MNTRRATKTYDGSLLRIAGLGLIVALWSTSNLFAQAFGTTAAMSVSITVGAEAAIQVSTSSTSLTASGTIFNNYTGTTSFSYKIRTTKTGGSGTVTLQVTSDFSPAGGPSVASPPTAGDSLSYACAVAAPGTGCSGTQTASTTAATSVVTFGADAHSVAAGTSGNSVSWTLANDPVYKTGSYNSTVTFTISST
jgi:hypothetical protein